MSPVFGHGALRLYLLSLLDEAPRHGYELMQALEARFGGTYSPSAGTIYPRLSKLEEEGLLAKTVDGRKTTYTITEAGRAELRAREGELHALESEITDSVRRMASDVRAGVQSAMQALRVDLAAAEREARSAARPTAHAASGAWGSWSDTSAHPAARVDNPAGPWMNGDAPEPQRAAEGSTQADATGAGAGVPRGASPVAPRADVRGRDAKTESRLAVHDIDLAVTAFRQEVREAARRRRADLTPEHVAQVRTELDSALERIVRLLG